MKPLDQSWVNSFLKEDMETMIQRASRNTIHGADPIWGHRPTGRLHPFLNFRQKRADQVNAAVKLLSYPSWQPAEPISVNNRSHTCLAG